MTSRIVRAYGVVVAIHADDPRLFACLDRQLPGFPREAGEGPGARLTYHVVRSPGTGIVVMRGRRTVAVAADWESASDRLVSDLQSALARAAAGWTFVHAGVVAIDGAALVLPASSRAGKSTLVAALLRAGARYGSDELAVIDQDGLVHPYSRQLALRAPDHSTARMRPDELGGEVVTAGLPVGALVFTEFQPGQAWRPERLSPGHVVLRLLQHCLGARGRPGETLRALRAVARRAPGFVSPRGDAEAAAVTLMAAARAGWHRLDARPDHVR